MENRAWERLENEPEGAYTTFRKWLDMPTPRRAAKFMRDSGVSEGTYELYHARYKWKERALAYDTFLGRQIDDSSMAAQSAFRSRIISDEANDYQLLQESWNKMYLQVLQDMGLDTLQRIKAMKQLAQMRLTIDSMARKAAQMPNNYLAKADLDGMEVITPDMIELTISGPKYFMGDGKNVAEVHEETKED